MSREITIPEKQVFQEIQSLKEFPSEKLIVISIGILDENNQFVVPQQIQTYQIYGDMYDELNSANPSWNPTKPEGTYFNEDLWHFIDLLNNA